MVKKNPILRLVNKVTTLRNDKAISHDLILESVLSDGSSQHSIIVIGQLEGFQDIQFVDWKKGRIR